MAGTRSKAESSDELIRRFFLLEIPARASVGPTESGLFTCSICMHLLFSAASMLWYLV